ncbi:hypothetical protein CIK94_09265 [Prevotella sp. P4-51]|nr:hypothetical protein CIK87_01500 [Prevotella sp. P5-64]OYP72747.1 hypothetical protein CIK94_09265 [Prevotella sp. P4-51]OYP75230.1 hypothetical protein CIK92_03375 [Prevotella sp. P4-67]
MQSYGDFHFLAIAYMGYLDYHDCGILHQGRQSEGWRRRQRSMEMASAVDGDGFSEGLEPSSVARDL